MSDQHLREVSPEEFQQMSRDSRRPRGETTAAANRFGGLTVPIALTAASLIVGFALGMQFEKGQTGSTRNTANTQASGRYGGMRGGLRGSFGAVSAIDTFSITIQNARTGSSQTYKITAATTVSNNGASASVSDIHTGDTVIVRPSSTDSGTAATILINPSFGGQTQPGTGSDDSSSNGSGTSTI